MQHFIERSAVRKLKKIQVARLLLSRETSSRSVLCQHQQPSTISLRKVSSPRPLHSAPKPSLSRSVL